MATMNNAGLRKKTPFFVSIFMIHDTRPASDASRMDDALWHRRTSRTSGGDAGPERAANPGRSVWLLGFAALRQPASDHSTGLFEWRGARTGSVSRTLSRLAVDPVWDFSGPGFEVGDGGGVRFLEEAEGCFMGVLESCSGCV
jgi:hypothetical protein